MFQDLNDLRLLSAIARAGSITEGARLLKKPAASVSRSLSALEAELGVRLIERSARRFKLTEVGVTYLQAANRVLEELSVAGEAAMGQNNELRGTIRIASTADFVAHFMAKPLADFCARHVDVKVVLALSPRRVNLIDEGFDLAVRIGVIDDLSLISRPLMHFTKGLYMCAKRAATENLARFTGHPPDPVALSALPWLALSTQQNSPFMVELTATGQTAPDAPKNVRFAVNPRIEGDSVAVGYELLLAGAGIAAMPDVFMQDAIAAGHVIRILPDWHAGAAQAHIVYPARSMPKRVRALVDHLTAHFKSV
jgi:DNA-binding transcriptional LysR family regulator